MLYDRASGNAVSDSTGAEDALLLPWRSSSGAPGSDSVGGGGLGLGISLGEYRPGFRVGVGATQRMTKSIVLVGNIGYTYVNVDGTLDPSLFTATIGLGFGG